MKLHHGIVAAVQVLCKIEDSLCSESHRQRSKEARKLQGITASLRLCKCCAERISILLPCFRAAVRNRSIEAAGFQSLASRLSPRPCAPAAAHRSTGPDEIWKFCQSTSRAHANVLHDLMVKRSPWAHSFKVIASSFPKPGQPALSLCASCSSSIHRTTWMHVPGLRLLL